MRNAFVLEKLEQHLQEFLQWVEKCPEDKRKVVPEGFKNSIHWHVGHVLTAIEFHVFGLSEHPLVLPESYQDFFAYGSSQADWKEEPPAWEILIALLKEQHNHIRESLKDKLEVPVKENVFLADNTGELILVTVIHMSNHTGIVSAQLKVLK